MRIQVLSDIHAEFHTDLAEQFITEYLKPKTVDILIVGGDLGVGEALLKAMTVLAKHYENVQILYVPGNHEFYGDTIPNVLEKIHKFEKQFDNVAVLNNRIMTFGGIDFIGTTLWFKQMPDYQRYTPLLNDFRVIQGFVPKVFEENKAAVDFLNWHVNDHSIVITHHSPTIHSTPMKFKEEPVNMFFTCDMEMLIKERKPKLWVHGHTHHSFNYMLHDTHIICNPLGYVGHEVNQEFISNLMIDYEE